jgi:O-methyltransferase / aklanonic acid methyltransferase
MDVTRHKASISSTFDRAAATFDASPVDFFAPIGHRLVATAGTADGEHVLDIGCGRGSCLFPASAAVGPTGSVTGIDISPAMILHTATEVQARGLTNVTVIEMDAENPDFPPESFDLALGSFSVMHLPAAPAVLGKYLPLLRPTGRLWFTDLIDKDGLPPFVPPAAFAVLVPYFPPGPNPRERGTDGWSATEQRIVDALTSLGFVRAEVREATYSMSVGSGANWIAWSMSTGLRAAWDNVPPAELPRVESAVVDVIDEMRNAAGEIIFPVPVRYIGARRPD